jgi:hypothetical protein
MEPKSLVRDSFPLVLSLIITIGLCLFLKNWYQHKFPVEIADAAGPLTFEPTVKKIKLHWKADKLFQWKGAEAYKNRILADYQRKLHARGIKDTKLFVAQLIQEAGSLDPATIGDHGCSFGIIQYNACSKHRMSAKAFLAKHPEWKTTEKQLTWMADSVAWRMKRYGNIRLAVISHNSPAAAARGVDTKAGYFTAVSKRLALLTNL